MDTLLQDIRYAARSLRRSPGFTIVAVLTLALGIGANAAIFSVVNGVLLRPLAYANPDQLVMVWGHNENIGNETASLPDFKDWRERNTVFESMAAVANTRFDVTGDGEPERVDAALTTANFFHVLGVTPALGRAFNAEEEASGRDRVVVLSARPTMLAGTLRHVRAHLAHRRQVRQVPGGFDQHPLVTIK